MTDFAIDETKCKECPLWETSTQGSIRRSGVYGRGSGSLGLWFYGEALGAEETRLGMPFMGDAGKILSGILKEINLPEDEVFISNSVRCRPNTGGKNRTPTVTEIKTCMKIHALKDVPPTPPKLVVLLGNVPLKAVLDKQKIKQNRGVIFDCDLFNCKAMATYHPAAIIYNKKTNIYDTLKADLLKAKEFILERKESPIKRHNVLINSKEVFLQWMGVLSDKNLDVRTCDIETTGLEYWNDQIASVSFTAEVEGEIFSVSFLCIPRTGWWFADLDDPEIREALQNVLILPTNFFRGLFDVQFFWHRGYAVNFHVDVMDQHVMVDENSPHNLEYCVSIYNKEDSGYKQRIAGLLGEEGKHADLPPEILLDYNNDDTYNTHKLYKIFTPIIKKEGLEDFFTKLAMPLERSLTRMSYRGIMMDRQGIIDLSNNYRSKIKEKRELLFEKAGKRFDYSGSSKDIKTVLFKDLNLPVVKRTEKGMPSSDKYAMEELARVSEVPEIILDLRKLEYYLRMYLDGNDLPYKLENGQMMYKEPKPGSGMLCRLDKNDRIHGSFLSGGTISGRPSCPKPNLLNIPKKIDVRRLFITQPGWSLIEGDYSQAELVALANFSQDGQFISDVNSDDFHAATARSLMKSENVDDETRKAAKAINFLKSYGGGAQKLGNTLRLQEEKLFFDKYQVNTKYDKVCPNYRAWHHKRDDGVPIKYKTVNRDRHECYVCEADTWLHKWDQAYPKVPDYKLAQMRLWKEQGYIMGIYGRKKRFPPVFNKTQESYCDRISVNYMCQNAVSETVNRSIVDINFLLDTIFNWTPTTMYRIPGIVLAVYDSIICEAPDELVPDIKELMNELMALPLPQLNISLKIDFKVSKRWGETDVKDDIIVDLDDDIEEEIVA